MGQENGQQERAGSRVTGAGRQGQQAQGLLGRVPEHAQLRRTAPGKVRGRPVSVAVSAFTALPTNTTLLAHSVTAPSADPREPSTHSAAYRLCPVAREWVR